MSTIPPRRIRTDLIRIKLAEIRDGISVVRANLPRSEADFLRLGLIKDGIYKKTGYAIENVLDICAGCQYTGFCAGGCPASVMARSGRLIGTDPQSCFRAL